MKAWGKSKQNSVESERLTGIFAAGFGELRESRLDVVILRLIFVSILLAGTLVFESLDSVSERFFGRSVSTTARGDWSC